MDNVYTMDVKDQSILDLLRENSRYSIREIAKKTKIRPSTVHQRMAKLLDSGIIENYTVKLNNLKVGEAFIVFMFVKTPPASQLSPHIIQNPHVKEIFGITGEYDILLKMKFKDVSEFNDYLIRFRREEKIETTHTYVATATIKEEI